MRLHATLVLLLALLFACKREAPAHEESAGGIRFVETFVQGADGSSPLVVALHGRGGSPERFARAFEGFSAKAELAFAEGPLPYEDGHQWFEWPPELGDDELADRVSAAAEKVWQAIAAIAHGRKVIVCGYSQGALVAYALAVRHADGIAYVFPIAGRAPYKLLPRQHLPKAPVYALHGTEDDTIAVTWARETVNAFKADGGQAELHELAGAGHSITPAMKADLVAHVAAALPR